MPISHKEKIIFVHIPKNAGSSIATSKEFATSCFGHHRCSFYKDTFPELWDTYLKVSIVRNPWDRFVSSFEYSKMINSFWHSNNGQPSRAGPHLDYLTVNNLCFEEFARKFDRKELKLFHQCWDTQSSWICVNNQLMVDKAFRLEEIGTDPEFKKLFRDLGVVNRSSRTHEDYRQYYKDKSLIKIVENAYSEDIKMFNYSF